MARVFVTKPVWHFQYACLDTGAFYRALIRQGCASQSTPFSDPSNGHNKVIFPGSSATDRGYTQT